MGSEEDRDHGDSDYEASKKKGKKGKRVKADKKEKRTLKKPRKSAEGMFYPVLLDEEDTGAWCSHGVRNTGYDYNSCSKTEIICTIRPANDPQEACK